MAEIAKGKSDKGSKKPATKSSHGGKKVFPDDNGSGQVAEERTTGSTGPKDTQDKK